MGLVGSGFSTGVFAGNQQEMWCLAEDMSSLSHFLTDEESVHLHQCVVDYSLSSFKYLF